MFTSGQTIRMRAALNGDRSGLLSSSGCSGSTSINEKMLKNAIEVFPNPSNGNFTINSNSLTSGNINITIYSPLGAKIIEFANIKTFPLNVTQQDLPNGIYYLRINSDNKTMIKKIVVSK